MSNERPLSRGLVVGLDLVAGRLTPGSEVALRDATHLASSLGLPVTLLHSNADDERWNAESAEFVRSRPIEADGLSELDAAVDRLRKSSVDAKLVVTKERCLTAVAAVVEETGADLVVVSKRSIDAADGRRLGSVAHSLIRDSTASVWASRASSGPLAGCILAAADLSAVGKRVVETAMRVAPTLEGDLHVVHALDLPLSIQMEGEASQDRYLEQKGQEARTKLNGWLDGTPATLHVGLTSPSQAVIAGARRLDPAVVVMGTVSRTGIPGLVIGNTAERLLNRIEASLLVVKPGPPT